MNARRYAHPQDMALKRRYARLQKAQGDVALLAGSPADAFDHYTGAIDLARVSNDAVWLAAALEGRVTAKVCTLCSVYATSSILPQLVDLATSEGAVRQTTTSAFAGDGMRNSLDMAAQEPTPAAPLSTSSASSGGGFGGGRFWSAMRAGDVEEDVRTSLAEAKRELRRKGAPSLQVELDLKLARFLVGMGGPGARAEVSQLVSAVVEAAASLQLPEDRLAAAVEAAQVVGAVGFARKRTLMLWQAVELSKSMERPDGATLDIAKKALEPPELDEHSGRMTYCHTVYTINPTQVHPLCCVAAASCRQPSRATGAPCAPAASRACSRWPSGRASTSRCGTARRCSCASSTRFWVPGGS